MPLIPLGDWGRDTAAGERPVQSSACGKVLLLGEHAVVYGEPALAIPLPGARLRVQLGGLDGGVGDRTLGPGDFDGLQTQDALKSVRARKRPRPVNPDLVASAPSVFTPLQIEVDATAPEGAAQDVSRALAAASHGLSLPMPLPLRLRVSAPTLASGMGTSAALAVALVRALARWHNEDPETGRVIQAAMAVEQLFHGNPSGVDVAVSAHERALWFTKAGGPTVLPPLPPLSLVLLGRRSPVATRTLVEGVRARLADDPALARVIAELGRATRQGRAAWEAEDIDALGAAMRSQHEGLDRLGVVRPEDHQSVEAALAAGAVGAKITGAGGGGSILALAPDEGTARSIAAAWGPGAQAFVGQ